MHFHCTLNPGFMFVLYKAIHCVFTLTVMQYELNGMCCVIYRQELCVLGAEVGELQCGLGVCDGYVFSFILKIKVP